MPNYSQNNINYIAFGHVKLLKKNSHRKIFFPSDCVYGSRSVLLRKRCARDESESAGIPHASRIETAIAPAPRGGPFVHVIYIVTLYVQLSERDGKITDLC